MQSSLLGKYLSLITPILLGIVSVIGVIAFSWPLLMSNKTSISAEFAPGLTAVILIASLLILFTAISANQLNSKVIALLGLLAALIAAARLLGAHAFGIEPMWAFVVIAGRALGPVIGFTAGSLGMASSALITGGLGPWLPFQMLASGWVGLLAGLIPFPKSKFEVQSLALFGAISAIMVGLLLNLWFWPTATIGNQALAYLPGDAIANNLSKLLAYSLVTSASFDIPRAIMTFLLILLVGGSMLRTLRRINRPVEFSFQEKLD